MTSFQPLQDGFSQSLLGVGTNPSLIDAAKFNARGLKSELGDDDVEFVKDSTTKLLLTVIISAIIFVTVVSIYDVIRNYINNHYANIALNDPNASNSQQDIDSTMIANQQGLKASVIFCGICVLIGSILLYFIVKYLHNH